MKRKNKKGSSLGMVVFVTAIIFMVGTVMLALVQTDYKSRMQRSQSIKSLYAADSGLNIVKNAINKEAEAAMFCAANQVKQDINGGNYKFLADGGVINKDKYTKINNIFKYYFITALTSNDVNADSNFSSISESDIKLETQPLCYAAKEKKYNTYGNDSDKACSISDLKSEKKDVIGDTNNEGKNATITIEGINVKRYGDVSPSE